MNIYDEVTRLPRHHRLALCRFILRDIDLSYEDKTRLLGRVPRINRDGQGRVRISKDAIA